MLIDAFIMMWTKLYRSNPDLLHCNRCGRHNHQPMSVMDAHIDGTRLKERRMGIGKKARDQIRRIPPDKLQSNLMTNIKTNHRN